MILLSVSLNNIDCKNVQLLFWFQLTWYVKCAYDDETCISSFAVSTRWVYYSMMVYEVAEYAQFI